MSLSEEFDVIVVGGGTSGSVAALASARRGAETLLVERSGYLGGMSAVGMTWGGFFGRDGKQIIRGIPEELVGKAESRGGGLGHLHYDVKHSWISSSASVDPEVYRLLLQDEIYQAGGEILLYSTLTGIRKAGDAIRKIVVANAAGSCELFGRTFIDATGDAVLSDLAGVQWERGELGKRQSSTSIFRIANVDVDALENFMEKKINEDKKFPWRRDHKVNPSDFLYWCPWKNDGFEDMPTLFGFYWHGFEGDVYINSTSKDVDALDPLSVSRGDHALRKEAFKVFDYLKSRVAGFENSYLAQVYPLGIRESRRIMGRYQVTLDDIVGNRSFPDVIGMGAYPPDIHAVNGEVSIDDNTHLQNQSGAYQIPYRSLLPQNSRNLITAGRCISASFEAQSALRGIGPCMVEGEAAGVAAVLANSMNIGVADLPVKSLQRELLLDGVYLGDKQSLESLSLSQHT